MDFFEAGKQYPQFAGSKAQDGPSVEAARRITAYLGPLRAKVLSYFVEQHPADFTADEVGARLGLSPFCSRPRCTELAKLGLLEKTARRVTGKSGYTAGTWRASAKAMGAGHD
jgi:hypothetical protein